MSRSIYLHPLAYLIGLEGVALLRSFAGDDHDAEFVADRLAEIRKLLDRADELGEPAVVPELRRGRRVRPLGGRVRPAGQRPDRS